ncbi:MAG: glycosyltransferase family 39 protein [Ignavibacteria bacterium]|nr:glycosyltransferase family 39 protein [Ignavibacteria bacterium]
MNSLITAIRQIGPSIFLALLAFLLHVTANALGFYDYFRDEFYYMACSDHLTWGYVDHPPLSIFLLWIIRLLLGDSLFAIRLLPAFASAGLVFLTGTITRELGGNSRSQFIASLAVLIAPIYLILCDFYSMNAFEPLFWMGSALTFIRLVKTENQKLWLLFGVLAGLGLQNKHSMAFFGIAVVAGLLAGAHRRQIFSRWMWYGGGLAVLIALPNIIWQATHGWPTLEFSQNATQYKNAPMSPIEFFFMQVIFQNPLTFPLWFMGLGALFLQKDLKRYRLFGIVYVFLFVLFVLQRGKPYYLSPIYPLLFAAGAVVFEDFVVRRSLGWLRNAYLTILILGGITAVVIFLPVLPVETYIRVSSALSLSDIKTERHGDTRLQQVLADRFGWREMTATVARVYQSLPPEDQSLAVIYTQNYGQAGAIDFFGKEYKLPPAVSGHNNYWLWGMRGRSGKIFIIVGGNAHDHAHAFTSVDSVAFHSNPYAMLYETNLTIYVCRKLKMPLADIWPTTKHFE